MADLSIDLEAYRRMAREAMTDAVYADHAIEKAAQRIADEYPGTYSPEALTNGGKFALAVIRRRAAKKAREIRHG